MKEAFSKYVSKGRLFSKKEKILAAVSGGIDSVVMLRRVVGALQQSAVAGLQPLNAVQEILRGGHFVLLAISAAWQGRWGSACAVDYGLRRALTACCAAPKAFRPAKVSAAV